MEAIVVTHTHWDREWYRPFQEFRYRLVELLRVVLDLIENDPEFAGFLLDGQSILLEDVLALRPEWEERIRRAVESGRLWVGPWYVLPDEFLVSGEALIRNLLRGIQLARRFGPWMSIGYTPDPFGHVGQLPQILRGFEIEAAVLQRGLDDHPTLLWWQSPDGSRVFTVYLRDGYGNASRLPDVPESCAEFIRKRAESLAPYTAVPMVLLMNGADHQFPNPRLSMLLKEAQAHLPDLHLRHASLAGYIQEVQEALRKRADSLSVVEGELRSGKRHPVLPGVLSTRIWLKQRNAAVQTKLERYAEPLSAFALHTGPLDQRRFLREAWRMLLQNHFHDSICGTGVDEVHEEMKSRFDQAEQIADLVAEQAALRLLGSHPTVPPPGWVASDPASMNQTVLVYNPVPGLSREAVTFSVPALPPGLTYRVVDERGEEIPLFFLEEGERTTETWTVSPAEWQSFLEGLTWAQAGRYPCRRVWAHPETSQGWVEWGDPTPEMATQVHQMARRLREEIPAVSSPWTIRATIHGKVSLAFLPGAVEGVGTRAYRIRIVPGERGRVHWSPLPAPVIENEFLRLRADARDGTLRLEDLCTGQVWAGLNRLEDGGEIGDVYNSCPPPVDLLVTSPAAPPMVQAYGVAPFGQCLEVRITYMVPSGLRSDRKARSMESVPLPVTVRAWLRPGVPRVDIETMVENRATDHRLRVVFPSGLRASSWVTESAFDLVARPVEGAQEADPAWAEQPVRTRPQHGFTFLEDGNLGFLLASEGLPEIEARVGGDGTVHLVLTLLRCVGWLSRDDFPARKGHAGPQLPTPSAQCIGTWTFRYSVIPYSGDRWEAIREAQRFHAPMFAAAASGLPGNLPWVRVESPSFMLTAIKPPEEGEGIIVRGYNASLEEAVARIAFWQPVREAWRVNLLEQKEEPLTPEGHVLTIPARPREIVSLRVLLWK